VLVLVLEVWSKPVLLQLLCPGLEVSGYHSTRKEGDLPVLEIDLGATVIALVHVHVHDHVDRRHVDGYWEPARMPPSPSITASKAYYWTHLLFAKGCLPI
jgi:hypothetical protein